MNERGIRQTRSGWQVYIKIKGEFRSKHFPRDTPIEELRRWRDERKARASFKIPDPVLEGQDFGSDCRRYLEAVEGMATYKDRAYRIRLWKAALGPSRPRSEITSVEIRRELEKWRAAGKSPGTLNLRRTALMHLYSVLDGKSARNPVRDVPPFREIPPALHLPTIAQVKRVIAKMPKHAKGKYRLLVLLWTGWPPSQLMKLEERDIDWRRKMARLPARAKGRGVDARWLPLLPQAIRALKLFKKWECFGRFSVHSLRHRLHDACRRANVPEFRVYDLRHLFLTTVALAAKDDRVVAELAQHSDIRMSRRYTEQSVSPRLAAAISKLGKLGR